MTAPPEGGQRGLSRVVLRDRLGIEVLLLRALGVLQLLDEAGAYLPTAESGLDLLPVLDDLSGAIGRAQLAFDLYVVALLQVLCVAGRRSEGNDAVPFRVVHPLVGLLVLIARLGSQRQDRKGLL